MVLINELTVEQINAALLHLQRSKDEVVGGNKGTTIQNITISNSGGGGNNVDYSGTIKNLATNIEKNKTAIEKNAGDIAKLKSDMANIEKSVEDTLQGLVDNGISDLSYDPLTKQLTITTNDGDIYQAIIEQDIGYLSYDSATNKLILTTGNQSQEITLPYIKSSEKGSANGVATLDENGRVPYSQLPESAMEFLGQWDASTNTPHLADGTGTNGDFYVVSVGGTVDFGTAQDPHIVTFTVNDRVVYEGDIAQWVRLPAGQVSSVNGQSGAVTLTASDIEYSTGVSIKAKIDANAVQADWNVSDTTSLAYIKNKPTIPASPVQSDWDVTDTTSLAYIKNKPTIPSTPTLVCCAKCLYSTCYNDVSINWRPDSNVYYTTASYQTAGNEALVFATTCAATSFIFVNGENSVTNHANNRWYSLTPGLQIKCNKVTINKLIASGVNPTYELEVNGTVCATCFNGVASCAKYLYACDTTTVGAVVEGGNEFNLKNSPTPHMWINFRGGVSNVIIGSGNADGLKGTLCAACFCGTASCADSAFISSWSPQMILDDNVSYDVPFVAFSPASSSDRNVLGLSTGRKLRYNPSTCTLCVPNICATTITAEAPDWKKLVCSCCGSSIWKIQPHMYYMEICGCCIRECDLYKLFCSVIVACADSRWISSGCGRWATAVMGQRVLDCGVACSFWNEVSALLINTSYLGLYCNDDTRIFSACYNRTNYLSSSSTSENIHGYFTM